MRGVDQVELAVGQALVEVPLGNLAASAIAGLLWTLASPRAAFAYLVAWMLLAWSAFCPPGAVGPDTYWCRPKRTCRRGLSSRPGPLGTRRRCWCPWGRSSPGPW